MPPGGDRGAGAAGRCARSNRASRPLDPRSGGRDAHCSDGCGAWPRAGARCALAGHSAAACAQDFDPAAQPRSASTCRRAGARRLQGMFPDYDGEVAILPDGRHRVRLRAAHARAWRSSTIRAYTGLTRGDGSSTPSAIRRSSSCPIRIRRAAAQRRPTATACCHARRAAAARRSSSRPAACAAPGARLRRRSPAAASTAATTASTAGSFALSDQRALRAARAPARRRRRMSRRHARDRGWLLLALLRMRGCVRPLAPAPARARRGGRRRAARSDAIDLRRADACAQPSPLHALAAERVRRSAAGSAAPLRADPRPRPGRAAGADQPDPQRAPPASTCRPTSSTRTMPASWCSTNCWRPRGAACACAC